MLDVPALLPTAREEAMSRCHDRSVFCPEPPARHLACAVIEQALLDVLDPTVPPPIKQDARAFLAGNEWYRMWCMAAGLHPVPLQVGLRNLSPASPQTH
jgi:hypothetical protein